MKTQQKFVVCLSAEQRQQLLDLTRRGRPAARMIIRANILLLADKGLSDDDIVTLLHVSLPTVGRVRKRFLVEGLDSALQERPRPGAKPKISAEDRAHFNEIVQSPPPGGQARWSLRTLASALIERHVVGSISHETVRSLLRQHQSSAISAEHGTGAQS